MVDGEKGVGARLKARLMRRGAAPGCWSLRSSRFRGISPVALEKWIIWGLDIRDASPLAEGAHRTRNWHAPEAIWCYLLNHKNSPARAGLYFIFRTRELQVSSPGQCLYFISRNGRVDVGAITTQIVEILGSGGPDGFEGAWPLRESSWALRGSRKVIGARGQGGVPGERFLDPVGPGKFTALCQRKTGG